MELDRDRRADPLYRQIARHYEREIRSSRLVVGDRLPSEPELVASLGVSRATANRALEELARRGLAERVRGSGTFVSAAPLDHTLAELSSFTEITEAAGRTAGQRLISYDEIEATGSGDDVDAPYEPGAPLALMVRLRLMDDQPVGLHRTAVPLLLARRAGLTEARLRRTGASLYAGLAAQGRAPTVADEWLTSLVSDPETERLFDCPPNTALMRIRRASRDSEGQLVEVVDATYLGSLYRYHVLLPSGQAHPGLGGTSRETQDRAGGTGMQFVGPDRLRG